MPQPITKQYKYLIDFTYHWVLFESCLVSPSSTLKQLLFSYRLGSPLTQLASFPGQLSGKVTTTRVAQ